jgi:hypothetical protein
VLGEWTDFVLETTWHCVKEIDMLYLEYRGKTTDKVAGRQSNWGIRRLNWVGLNAGVGILNLVSYPSSQ